jgi:hypothetical protein
MTRRRAPSDGTFTPKVIDTYKRARAQFNSGDDEEAFQQAANQLSVLLDRTAPWLTDIFETADNDPPDWLVKVGGEQLQRWHDAKQTLNALEAAAKDA